MAEWVSAPFTERVPSEEDVVYVGPRSSEVTVSYADSKLGPGST